MAYFKINRFKGIAPAVSPRLLAEGIGQTAENVDLESGRLVHINANDTDGFADGDSSSIPASITLASTTKNSIYVYNQLEVFQQFCVTMNANEMEFLKLQFHL